MVKIGCKELGKRIAELKNREVIIKERGGGKGNAGNCIHGIGNKWDIYRL